MWYAGLDWADTHHDVVVLDEAGQQIAAQRVAHTKAGLSELTQFLEHISGSQQKDQLACVVETNRGLLIAALLEAGFRVYGKCPQESGTSALKDRNVTRRLEIARVSRGTSALHLVSFLAELCIRMLW